MPTEVKLFEKLIWNAAVCFSRYCSTRQFCKVWSNGPERQSDFCFFIAHSVSSLAWIVTIGGERVWPICGKFGWPDLSAALGKEAINSLQGNEQVVETALKRMEGACGTQTSSYSYEPELFDNFICCLASCGWCQSWSHLSSISLFPRI